MKQIGPRHPTMSEQTASQLVLEVSRSPAWTTGAMAAMAEGLEEEDHVVGATGAMVGRLEEEEPSAEAQWHSFPSCAGSEVSGLAGDDDAHTVDKREIIIDEAEWGTGESACRSLPGSSTYLCEDGEWEETTHGDGEDAESVQPGQFGLMSGNWGTCYNTWLRHINIDVKSSCAAIIMIQEGHQKLLSHLKAPGEDGVLADESEQTHGSGVKWQKRPTYQYLGFKAPGDEHSLMICGRKSIVAGMRLVYFKRRNDGLYSRRPPKSKRRTLNADNTLRLDENEEQKINKKMAISRIMVVRCKMRYWSLKADDSTRGGGGRDNNLTTMNIHLNNLTAKKEIEKGGESLKLFFDEIAHLIIRFGARVLSGDFNMAMWQVAGELLARGIQVNLAAWFPWQAEQEDAPRIDSEAIWIIGPCSGARLIFDSSILGVTPPTRTEKWSNVENIMRDPTGKEVGREPFKLATFNKQGQGYPLTSYHPKNRQSKELFIAASFEPALARCQVQEFRQLADKRQGMFNSPVDAEIGAESWNWARMPICRQKLVDADKFDPTRLIFQKGAHRPLLVFFGEACDSRRSEAAVSRRADAAWKRGHPASGRWRVAVDHGVAYIAPSSASGGTSRPRWVERGKQQPVNTDRYNTRGGGAERDRHAERKGNGTQENHNPAEREWKGNDAGNTRGGGAQQDHSSWSSRHQWSWGDEKRDEKRGGRDSWNSSSWHDNVDNPRRSTAWQSRDGSNWEGERSWSTRDTWDSNQSAEWHKAWAEQAKNLLVDWIRWNDWSSSASGWGS